MPNRTGPIIALSVLMAAACSAGAVPAAGDGLDPTAADTGPVTATEISAWNHEICVVKDPELLVQEYLEELGRRDEEPETLAEVGDRVTLYYLLDHDLAILKRRFQESGLEVDNVVVAWRGMESMVAVTGPTQRSAFFCNGFRCNLLTMITRSLSCTDAGPYAFACNESVSSELPGLARQWANNGAKPWNDEIVAESRRLDAEAKELLTNAGLQSDAATVDFTKGGADATLLKVQFPAKGGDPSHMSYDKLYLHVGPSADRPGSEYALQDVRFSRSYHGCMR